MARRVRPHRDDDRSPHRPPELPLHTARPLRRLQGAEYTHRRQRGGQR